MAWQQLLIHSRADQAETIADALQSAGAVSVTFSDDADSPIFEPELGTTPLWPTTQVTGLFAEDCDLRALIEHLQQALPQAVRSWDIQPLAEQIWERAWLQYFHPMAFGDRLWICPSDQTPPQPHAVNVILDPGLAFGTGTHPTTALCLEWLDRNLHAGVDLLDYGCGSGILGIAAARLGARTVQAVDIDPQALLATKENANKNKVLDRIRITSPENLQQMQYDIVMANILAGPLQTLAATFADLVRPGGRIVLSGILEDQVPGLAASYEPWFIMDTRTVRDNWACVAGTRK